MVNGKGKKELNLKDQKVLNEILAKGTDVIRDDERAILVARRSYLTNEDLERYEIEGAEETVVDEVTTDPVDPPENTAKDYSGLSKAELIEECKKRNIEVVAKDTIQNLIELLEADDEGLLEDDEEDK